MLIEVAKVCVISSDPQRFITERSSEGRKGNMSVCTVCIKNHVKDFSVLHTKNTTYNPQQQTQEQQR